MCGFLGGLLGVPNMMSAVHLPLPLWTTERKMSGGILAGVPDNVGQKHSV